MTVVARAVPVPLRRLVSRTAGMAGMIIASSVSRAASTAAGRTQRIPNLGALLSHSIQYWGQQVDGYFL